MPCDLGRSSDSLADGLARVPGRLGLRINRDQTAGSTDDGPLEASPPRGWTSLTEACAADLREATETGDAASIPMLIKALADFALVERGAIRVGSRRVQQALRVGRLSLARRLITLHLSQMALSPTTVADLLGVSVRYLHVLFEATEKSFWQTVIAERINLARRMLREAPQQPITDIAHSCGFGSLATFYRVFGALEGRTPGEFRGDDAIGAFPPRSLTPRVI
jgi:AraC-like DNA-binding protein